MIPLIYPVLAGLTAVSAYVVKKRSEPKMTAERILIYQNLLNSRGADPEKLRTMAAVFAGEGLQEQADKLYMRAMLRELTPEQKEARAEAFRKGMASKDPEEIFKLADAFEATASDGVAKTLRDYAAGL